MLTTGNNTNFKRKEERSLN